MGTEQSPKIQTGGGVVIRIDAIAVGEQYHMHTRKEGDLSVVIIRAVPGGFPNA